MWSRRSATTPPALDIQGSTVTVNGDIINTSGNNSDGVQLVSLDGPIDLDANAINTSGDNSTAALLQSAGAVNLNVGVLQTQGSRALGLDISTNPATCVILGNGGCDVTAAADQITTNGFGGIGALVTGTTGVTTIDVDALQTGGDEAAGTRSRSRSHRLRDAWCGCVRPELHRRQSHHRRREFARRAGPRRRQYHRQRRRAQGRAVTMRSGSISRPIPTPACCWARAIAAPRSTSASSPHRAPARRVCWRPSPARRPAVSAFSAPAATMPPGSISSAIRPRACCSAAVHATSISVPIR